MIYNKRLTLLVGFLLGGLLSTINSAVITVAEGGMASRGSDRYGFASGWETSGWERPEVAWAGHWYDSSSRWGSQRTVHMQVPLSSLYDLPAFDATTDFFQSITLNIYVESTTGSGSSLRHIGAAASATGDATDGLSAGAQDVTDINNVSGWHSIDVTSFVLADLNQSFDFSVFTYPQKGNSSLYFRSSSHSDPGFHPYIDVTHIPEPGAFAAIIGALALGVVGYRKRRFRSRS